MNSQVIVIFLINKEDATNRNWMRENAEICVTDDCSILQETSHDFAQVGNSLLEFLRFELEFGERIEIRTRWLWRVLSEEIAIDSLFKLRFSVVEERRCLMR